MMKKRNVCLSYVFLLCALLLCACVQLPTRPSLEDTTPTWQEQYDLGVRYLSEGNYKEAIIAFTAAIEIDPKRAEAYVGRGGAYVLSGETEENLTAAKADYETAIELDETNAEAYLGLADVYIRQGDYDKALEILKQGLEKTGGNQEIEEKIAEMEKGNVTDSSGKIWRETVYDPDGSLQRVYDYTYDSRGFETRFYCTSYVEGEGDYYAMVEDFDENGYPYRRNYYDADGSPTGTYDLMTFNKFGQEIERYKYYPGDNMTLFRYYYNENGDEIKYEAYENGETLESYLIYEYDENGVLTGATMYSAEGEVIHNEVYN